MINVLLFYYLSPFIYFVILVLLLVGGIALLFLHRKKWNVVVGIVFLALAIVMLPLVPTMVTFAPTALNVLLHGE